MYGGRTMVDYNIYNEISERTNGDVYIGVVGPVRTGKSTFIKRFMDLLVLPNIDNAYRRERARDELPQSASGRTIMTTEPKFIPDEAVEITLDKGTSFRAKMIDCVGYVIPGAMGHTEEDMPRMVSTPWYDEDVPFIQAAEIGTRKVICDHSTIGLMVTTDGSISDIPRDDYVEAEARVARELHEINKPFVILLNSTHPESGETKDLADSLKERYSAPVIPVDALDLELSDIHKIMQTVLYEFPVSEIRFYLPHWLDSLPGDHWLKSEVYSEITGSVESSTKISDVYSAIDSLKACEHFKDVDVYNSDLGTGSIGAKAVMDDKLFYKVLSEQAGSDIEDEYGLAELISSLTATKKKYDKVSQALADVERCGYGIVSPSTEELSLDEPKIVKQGSRFGVKLRASAPSIHMIKANIETEVSPIVGTEKQSEELVHYLLEEFENDPVKIWDSNLFGKSLYELVNEGLHNKLYRMPDEARTKLQETLQKIINEGSGGLICIIL